MGLARQSVPVAILRASTRIRQPRPILSISGPQQQPTDRFYNFLCNAPRRDNIIGAPPPVAIYNLVAEWNLQQNKLRVKVLRDVIDPKSHKAAGRIKTGTILEWDTAVV